MLNIARNTAIDKVRSQEFQNSQKNQDLDTTINTIDKQEYSQFDVDAIGVKKVIDKLKPEHRLIIDLLLLPRYTKQKFQKSLVFAGNR
jgi:RNA polymerase sigma-70 factor (ECF subfamily)